MLERIKKYWKDASVIIAIVSLGITIGVYKNTIDYLKEDAKHNKEMWQKQLDINKDQAVTIGQLTTIIKMTTNEESDDSIED